MSRKAVFFDIDGTLFNPQVLVPESTKKAIKQLRENGHLAFVCTGRSRSYITPAIIDIGFDGIVAGCGTYISFQGKELMNITLPNDLIDKSLRVFAEEKMYPVLEGRDWMYFDEDDENCNKWSDLFDTPLRKISQTIKDNIGCFEVNKITIFINVEENLPNVRAKLQDDYELIQHSNIFMEFVPKGINKGTAIIEACKRLGINIENTYAFGDSNNDLGMFEVVKTPIAMGNGSQEAKDAAVYITDNIENDGIWKGLKHFGLI